MSEQGREALEGIMPVAGDAATTDESSPVAVPGLQAERLSPHGDPLLARVASIEAIEAAEPDSFGD